jgi:hypothetical protein
LTAVSGADTFGSASLGGEGVGGGLDGVEADGSEEAGVESDGVADDGAVSGAGWRLSANQPPAITRVATAAATIAIRRVRGPGLGRSFPIAVVL